MKNDMYFLPILARAIKASDRKTQLHKAMEAIKSLSRDPENATGYHQFLQFMQAAKESRQAEPIKLVIRKEDQDIKTIVLDRPSFTYRVSGIAPGFYSVELSTGWALWEESLTDEDLIWTVAYPQADIRLAAKTEDGVHQPTGEFFLLDGRLILRVFPSFENGWIEVETVALR